MARTYPGFVALSNGLYLNSFSTRGHGSTFITWLWPAVCSQYTLTHSTPFVQWVNSTNHRIERFPFDHLIAFGTTYPIAVT